KKKNFFEMNSSKLSTDLIREYDRFELTRGKDFIVCSPINCAVGLQNCNSDKKTSNISRDKKLYDLKLFSSSHITYNQINLNSKNMANELKDNDKLTKCDQGNSNNMTNEMKDNIGLTKYGQNNSNNMVNELKDNAKLKKYDHCNCNNMTK